MSPRVSCSISCRPGSPVFTASFWFSLVLMRSRVKRFPPYLLGSAPRSLSVRGLNDLPHVSLGLRFVLMLSGVGQSPLCLLGSPPRSHAVKGQMVSLKSPWVSPLFPCCQGSDSLPSVSLGLPLVLMLSGVKQSNLCLLGSPLRSLAVWGQMVSPMSPWVSPLFSCYQGSNSLPYVSLGIPLVLYLSGVKWSSICLLGSPFRSLAPKDPPVSSTSPQC